MVAGVVGVKGMVEEMQGKYQWARKLAFGAHLAINVICGDEILVTCFFPTLGHFSSKEKNKEEFVMLTWTKCLIQWLYSAFSSSLQTYKNNGSNDHYLDALNLQCSNTNRYRRDCHIYQISIIEREMANATQSSRSWSTILPPSHSTHKYKVILNIHLISYPIPFTSNQCFISQRKHCPLLLHFTLVSLLLSFLSLYFFALIMKHKHISLIAQCIIPNFSLLIPLFFSHNQVRGG